MNGRSPLRCPRGAPFKKTHRDFKYSCKATTSRRIEIGGEVQAIITQPNKKEVGGVKKWGGGGGEKEDEVEIVGFWEKRVGRHPSHDTNFSSERPSSGAAQQSAPTGGDFALSPQSALLVAIPARYGFCGHERFASWGHPRSCRLRRQSAGSSHTRSHTPHKMKKKRGEFLKDAERFG